MLVYDLSMWQGAGRVATPARSRPTILGRTVFIKFTILIIISKFWACRSAPLPQRVHDVLRHPIRGPGRCTSLVPLTVHPEWQRVLRTDPHQPHNTSSIFHPQPLNFSSTLKSPAALHPAQCI